MVEIGRGPTTTVATAAAVVAAIVAIVDDDKASVAVADCEIPSTTIISNDEGVVVPVVVPVAIGTGVGSARTLVVVVSHFVNAK